MFPGATADREVTDYVLLGALLDILTSFEPGTRFGPNRTRRFTGSFDGYDRRTDRFFADLRIHDAGDIHTWDDVPEYVRWLTESVRDTVWNGAIPIVIGGGHIVTAAGVAGVDLNVLVCLDTRLDFHRAYNGNEWSHTTVTHRVLDELGVNEAVALGTRTDSPDEWEHAAADDATVVEPEVVLDWEPAFSGGQSVYLSVDIDAADPAFAPGTGTAEPFGLTSREMRDVVWAIAPRADGFDAVEINDHDGGQAASLATRLLREFAFAHAARRS